MGHMQLALRDSLDGIALKNKRSANLNHVLPQ